MVYDSQNIFARILRGEISCRKVFENDDVLAFHDITPKAPVHILVLPKNPYVDMTDFTARATTEEIAALFRAIGDIVREQGLEEMGYRLINNCGLNGGQEVPHLHLHILAGRALGPMVVQSK